MRTSSLYQSGIQVYDADCLELWLQPSPELSLADELGLAECSVDAWVATIKTGSISLTPYSNL